MPCWGLPNQPRRAVPAGALGAACDRARGCASARCQHRERPPSVSCEARAARHRISLAAKKRPRILTDSPRSKCHNRTAMIALIQRVSAAQVRIAGEPVARHRRGCSGTHRRSEGRRCGGRRAAARASAVLPRLSRCARPDEPARCAIPAARCCSCRSSPSLPTRTRARARASARPPPRRTRAAVRASARAGAGLVCPCFSRRIWRGHAGVAHQ